MPIDSATDDLVAITKVCRKFPGANGKPRALNTVIRWILVGSISKHGSPPVKLEAIRVGGHWYTTDDAIRRFADELTRQAVPVAAGRSIRRSVEKRKERSMKRLRAKGICK